MIIILIIINILVSLFYTKKVKTVVNPCLILSTMWVVIISFYNIFCNSILGQIEETTYFIEKYGHGPETNLKITNIATKKTDKSKFILFKTLLSYYNRNIINKIGPTTNTLHSIIIII